MVVDTVINANSPAVSAVSLREIHAPTWWVHARNMMSEIREAIAQTFDSLLSEAGV